MFRQKINTIQIIIGLIICKNMGFAADESWKIYDDSEVAEVHITIDQEKLDWIYANVESDSLHLAQLRFKNRYIDETVENIGFRLRGNTSRHSAKKSFKISFNAFVQGREFYGLDKMNLNSEHNDPSIIRSKICWDWFNEIGMTASRAAHAAVYINDVYYGLYISVEHVDDEFIDKHYQDPSGNLWKCLWPADLTYLGSRPDDYYPDSDGRPYELSTNEDEYDYSQLLRFIDLLNNTTDDDFVDSMEQILVVPEVLNYFAMNILTGSWDDYRFLKNNYYLYYEPGVNRFHFIPYDYDNTFGISWFDTDWATVNPYNYPSNDNSGRPLMRLLAVPEYRNLYTHMLEFYSENVTKLSLNESSIDNIKTMITPWAEADQYRTYDYGFSVSDFHQSYTESVSASHVRYGLKPFIEVRNLTLSNQLMYLDSGPIIYDLDYQPKYPGPGDSIYVTAAVATFNSTTELVGKIEYYSDNFSQGISYPMLPDPVEDTKKIEEADRWTGVIPPLSSGENGHFLVKIGEEETILSRYPRSGTIDVRLFENQGGSLKINEFLASNSTINTDEAGENDDWLEIINIGDQAVALSGMYLTDKTDNLTKWQFPFGGSILEPGEFLLIWCDEDEEQGGYHTNFKLSADGEYIAIVAADGITIIDSLSFGKQETDISYGRLPDGADNWQFFNSPTPGNSNGNDNGLSEERIVQEFKVLANFPNPFNASTVVEYRIPIKSKVRVNILNINGQLVQTLHDGELPAGEYRVHWNAETFSSGIYFCILETADYRDIIKMMLLK